MAQRSMRQREPRRNDEDRRDQALCEHTGPLFAAAVLAACLALPAAAMAREVFDCGELKAAVADAKHGFASHKGALKAQASPSPALGKTYLARQSMAGATACSVSEVKLDEPKMRLRQTAYGCRFAGVSKLDAALRTRLMRCVAGEVDDPSDPDDLTIWVDRVSSGEGYRGTEVNAQANAVDGLTLLVRQSVCTNHGGGQACED